MDLFWACSLYLTGSGSTLTEAQNNANANAQKQADGMVCKTVHKSTASKITKTRNNCGAVCTGSSVDYPVAAGKFTSCVSQADADSIRDTWMSSSTGQSEAQTYANENGTCSCPCLCSLNGFVNTLETTPGSISVSWSLEAYRNSGDCSLPIRFRVYFRDRAGASLGGYAEVLITALNQTFAGSTLVRLQIGEYSNAQVTLECTCSTAKVQVDKL